MSSQFSVGNDDGHSFPAADSDGDIVDANRDWVTSHSPFVQHFDLSAFNESEFDEPAFKLGAWEGRTYTGGIQLLNNTAIATVGQPQPDVSASIHF